MDIGSFLIANQVIVAPIIELGGTLIFLAVVLSPFLIIRHRFFKPVRWWTIIGAYFVSYLLFLIFLSIQIDILEQLTYNFLLRYNLLGSYTSSTGIYFYGTFLSYTFLVFYATKLMYGSFTRKRFWVSVLTAFVLFFILLFILVTVTPLIILYGTLYFPSFISFL